MNHCYGGPGPHVFGNQYSGNIVVVDPPVDNANYHALKALMCVGGARPRAGENHRDQVRQRHDVGRHRDAASAVSVSEDRGL